MEITLIIILTICMIIHIILHIDNRFFDKSNSKQAAVLEEMMKNAQSDIIATKREYENIVAQKNKEIRYLYEKYSSAIQENTRLFDELNELKNDNTGAVWADEHSKNPQLSGADRGIIDEIIFALNSLGKEKMISYNKEIEFLNKIRKL